MVLEKLSPEASLIIPWWFMRKAVNSRNFKKLLSLQFSNGLKHDVVTVLDCDLRMLIRRVHIGIGLRNLTLPNRCFNEGFIFLVWSNEHSYLEAELYRGILYVLKLICSIVILVVFVNKVMVVSI